MRSQESLKTIRDLRAKGYTYSEISQHIGDPLPKSSLSYICRNVILEGEAKQRLASLRANQLRKKQAKALLINKAKQQKKILGIESRAQSVTQSLDDNALKIALAMLYWGEGAKYSSYRGLSLGSSDPAMLRTYIFLLEKCYGISRSSLKARIMCRADQNQEELKQFWSHTLFLPPQQFYKTYADTRTKSKPTKKSSYRGVCAISCAGTHVQLELTAIWKSIATQAIGNDSSS